MKKIFAILLLVLFTSSTVLATPVVLDSDGFQGYDWGADFNKVSKEISLTNLSEKSTDNIVQMYTNIDDIHSNIGFIYVFSNNYLTQGYILFFSSTEFDSAISGLHEKFGQPKKDSDDRKNTVLYYDFPKTIISYIPEEKVIVFSNKIFLFIQKLEQQERENSKNKSLN